MRYGLAGGQMGLFLVGVHVFYVLVPLFEPHCALAALSPHVKLPYYVLITPVGGGGRKKQNKCEVIKH